MKTTLATLKYSIVTDETDTRGLTRIITRDHRGYWLADNRYGGHGWPTRDAALERAMRGAR